MARKISSHQGSKKAYSTYGGRFQQDTLAPGTTSEQINAMPENRRRRSSKAHDAAARDSYKNRDYVGTEHHTRVSKSLKG